MSFCSIPVQNSGMAQALQVADFEFCFAGEAVGANGIYPTLLASQKSAAGSVMLALGGTATANNITTATLIAKFTTMFALESYQASQVPQYPISAAEQAALITGLANHFSVATAGLEAKGNGGDAIGFCIQGLPIKQILSIEFELKMAASMANILSFKAGPGTQLPEPVTLGAASKIIKTGTTEIDFDADPLCFFPKYQTVLGALRVTTAATMVPAAGDIIVLRIKAIV